MPIMNDEVKKYLQDKYESQLGDINSAQAFANLGDVISGQKVGSQNAYYDTQRKQAREGTIEEIDRKERMDLERYKKDQELELRKQALYDRLEQQRADRELKKQILDQNRIQRQEREASLQDRKSLAREMKDEKAIQGLSKSVEGTQSALTAIDNIESALGAPLESFKKENGNLILNGSKVDLPGVSIPGIGRVSGYSTEARDLQSKASTVFNSVLKDRSGAAVTNSELERLRKEFGQGDYNTEAELVEALKQYKIGLANELRNREAAFPKETVQQYSERGGRTSMSMPKELPKISNAIDSEELKSIERQKRIQELRSKVGGQ